MLPRIGFVKLLVIREEGKIARINTSKTAFSRSLFSFTTQCFHCPHERGESGKLVSTVVDYPFCAVESINQWIGRTGRWCPRCLCLHHQATHTRTHSNNKNGSPVNLQAQVDNSQASWLGLFCVLRTCSIPDDGAFGLATAAVVVSCNIRPSTRSVVFNQHHVYPQLCCQSLRPSQSLQVSSTSIIDQECHFCESIMWLLHAFLSPKSRGTDSFRDWR